MIPALVKIFLKLSQKHSGGGFNYWNDILIYFSNALPTDSLKRSMLTVNVKESLCSFPGGGGGVTSTSFVWGCAATLLEN